MNITKITQQIRRYGISFKNIFLTCGRQTRPQEEVWPLCQRGQDIRGEKGDRPFLLVNCVTEYKGKLLNLVTIP